MTNGGKYSSIMEKDLSTAKLVKSLKFLLMLMVRMCSFREHQTTATTRDSPLDMLIVLKLTESTQKEKPT